MRALVLVLCGAMIVASSTAGLSADDASLAANAGFEAADLSPWQWRNSGDAQGSGQIDTRVAHGGRRSFRMSTRSGPSPNVFTVLQQNIAVKPNTSYRVGAWFKGHGVGYAWLGGGHGWQLREVLPIGDFDWAFVSVNLTTHPKETQFDLILALEDVTSALWIDDVEMIELGQLREPRIYSPRAQTSVSDATTRFHPAMPAAHPLNPPAVKVGRAGSALQVTFQARWDDSGLSCEVNVVDSTTDARLDEAHAWDGDQVAIAIDTKPGRVIEGYDEACYELAVAMGAGNSPMVRVTAGAATFAAADMERVIERTPSGYVLRLRIPWHSLSLDPLSLPAELGINVKVTDGAHVDRPIAWTLGMTPHRRPNEFARLAIVRSDRNSATSFRLSNDTFDRGDWIAGTYTEFATVALPAASHTIMAVSTDETPPVEVAQVKFPAIGPKSIRQVDFLIPTALFDSSATWQLHATAAGKSMAISPIEIIDSSARVRETLPRAKQRLREIRAHIDAHPRAKEDLYLRAAIAVAAKFVDRVQSDTSTERQTPVWSLLQVREVESVLDEAQKRLNDIANNAAQVMTAEQFPPVRKFDIDDGVLHVRSSEGVAQRPIYLVGYVGWGDFMKEFPATGANYAHREVLPWTMNPNGTLNAEGETVMDALRLCEQRGITLDLLLAPHNFPQWAIDEAPEIANIRSFGFLKHNIDHPVARRVMEQWLGTIVAKVKDAPALGSICLSNEPTYVQSGRDPWSRPYWIEYLKKKYVSVGRLNEHYGSAHASFEQVPVPQPNMPTRMDEQRLYYDWCRFNQEHFTDWHRWMNGIIKSHAPAIPTHTKIMNTVWDRDVVCNGVDAELMTDWSDIAGNDAYAQWSPDGVYAYKWQLEQAWYDLLHSFGGKPVHNSENHLIFEGRLGSIPPQHTHAVLWQGALHHQAMTTMWVWGEADTGELRGNISLRPANLYAACRATLDLNRLAPQIAALSRAKPRVAILRHPFSLRPRM